MSDNPERLRSDLDLAIKALQGMGERESLEEARFQAEVALDLLAHRLGDPQALPERESGTVKWFDRTKGYNFIVRDRGGSDLFVHNTGLRDQRYPWLEGEQRVVFTIGHGERGPLAQDVVVLGRC